MESPDVVQAISCDDCQPLGSTRSRWSGSTVDVSALDSTGLAPRHELSSFWAVSGVKADCVACALWFGITTTTTRIAIIINLNQCRRAITRKQVLG